ncbi:MAG: hypothetical protein Q7J38_09225, partial [Gallionella sp.]|nr:hypothetical protein [Gallionella sp.]
MANTAPTFSTLNGTPTYTENGAAVVLDADVQIVDAELAAVGYYGGASLTLARNGGANAQDIFSNSGTLGVLAQGSNLTVGGVIIGTVTTNSSGTLTLTFNGSATQSLVNSAMQQIAYSNNSNAPSASAQIDWTFNDGNIGAQGTGGALAVTSSTTVNITAINNAPSFVIGNGMVTTAVGAGNDQGSSIALQADGKILIAGSSYNGTNDDFALARYNIDGSLDASFSGDGKLTTAIGAGNDYGESVALQADGKILVTGQQSPVSGNNSNFGIARYNTDGSLDTSFDTNGSVTTDFFGGIDASHSVTQQSDGKILVSGINNSGGMGYFALARYNSDGSLDTSFDMDGMVTTGFGIYVGANTVIQQLDGKILVVGSSSNGYCVLARYNTDGSLDTSFDTDGRVTTTSFGGSAYSATLQADGKILVAGGNTNFSLARYNTDGSLDTSFDMDGKVTTDFGGNYDYGHSITLQADGKILVAGGRDNGSNYDFALARYNIDGSLDASFDMDGKVTTTIGANAGGYGVTVQADGKILVAGSSNNGSNNDFALARYNADGSLDTTFNPINTLNGTPTYTENGTAVVLDSDVQIVDTELAASGNYASASLTLARNGGVNVQDVFSNSGTLGTLTQGGNLTVGGVAIGTITTNSGGTLTFTFNGSATQSLVNLAMQQIAYSNSSDAPSASVQIDWTFNDGNIGAQGSGGALAATGSTTVSITAINDAPTGTVTISGTAIQNQTLTASNTLADVDGLGAINYQWQADGIAISGATNSTYVLTQAEVGKTISIVASYTDGHGTVEAVASSSTNAVANINDSPTGSVTIAGIAIQGQTLAASNTLADVDGLGAINYQWQADGIAISGATNSTYVLTQAEVGKTISVVASYTDARGTAETVTGSSISVVVNAGATCTTNFSSWSDFENLLIATQAYESSAAFISIENTVTNLTTQLFSIAASSYTSTSATGYAGGLTAHYYGTNFGTASQVVTSANITDGTNTLSLTGSVSISGQYYVGTITSMTFNGQGYIEYAVGQIPLGASPAVITSWSSTNPTTLGAVSFASTGTQTVYSATSATASYSTTSVSDAFGHSASISGLSFSISGDPSIPINLVDALHSMLSGNDVANGSSGNDELQTFAGNDTLDGKSGTDTMVGGLGNDTYVVDVAGDVITEVSGEGTDQVNVAFAAAGAYTLSANLENATVTSGATIAANITGNADNNILTGNAAANTLDGGAGNDTLDGGSGNDALIGGADTDTANFSGNRSQHTLTATTTGWTLNGADGNDTLTGIEFAHFADQTISLGNYAPTGSVTISGTATQSQTLTASNTLADLNGLGTISYQWKADGINITGATGSTYVMAEAQVGKIITVAASYTDLHGTAESVASTATTAVANINDTPTGSVTLTGTATQNQTLTAANTLTDIDGLGIISYQWQANGTNISGATNSTHILTEGEVGKTVTVVAIYTDGHGMAESVASSATAAIANVNDAPTGSVTITGTAAKGQTLTASNTLADADGLGSIGYQWQADGLAINVATNGTYLLTQAEVGKTISVVATYTDGHGTAEAVTSSSTANVYVPSTSRYTLLGTGANLMDFYMPYGNLSLDGQNIVFKGNSSIDTVYVGSANGLAFDFTQAGLGVDQIYLSGSWADYARGYSGSV